MNERIFDVGDTVMLKSGGTIMTVRGYAPQFDLHNSNATSKTDVMCDWFENEVKKHKTFKQDMLKFANQ